MTDLYLPTCNSFVFIWLFSLIERQCLSKLCHFIVLHFYHGLDLFYEIRRNSEIHLWILIEATHTKCVSIFSKKDLRVFTHFAKDNDSKHVPDNFTGFMCCICLFQLNYVFVPQSSLYYAALYVHWLFQLLFCILWQSGSASMKFPPTL